MATLTSLILVCCHAIYLGGPTRGTSSSEWLLASFQTDEVPTFTAHINAGLSLLASDPSSILVFSGGKTRSETEKSEAQSYLDLCLDNDFWGIEGGKGLRERILLEEKALDSFGNLVHGILAFWRDVGRWPEKIEIVSHEFKRGRFLDLHVKAMRWPVERVGFVGLDPEYMVEGTKEWDEVRAEEVRTGERERGYRVWDGDLLGRGEALRGKRDGRDCWGNGKQRLLFHSAEERGKSEVRSEILRFNDGVVEEVLIDEVQPWEVV